MSDLISRLRGDGYLLLNIHERQTLDYEAADELDRLNADVATLRSEVRGLHETSNTLHMDRDRLNAQALELCAEISGLRRENERLRGLLREARKDIGENAGFDADIQDWTPGLCDRIDAALAGAADQPSVCLRCHGKGAIDAATSADDPTCPDCDGEGVKP